MTHHCAQELDCAMPSIKASAPASILSTDQRGDVVLTALGHSDANAKAVKAQTAIDQIQDFQSAIRLQHG